MQDKLSSKCLASEITAVPLIKNMFYVVAGGQGSGFLGNTLEEEHTGREFVSF